MAKGTIALGQYRGKVGGQVLRVVDGKQVMQAYQPSVRNPRTHAQQLQRGAMKKLGKMSRGFLSILKEGYGGVYPASSFIKANISRQTGALSVLTEDDVTVNYGQLQVTNGNAAGLVLISAGTTDWGETNHLTCATTCNVTLASGIERGMVRLRMAVYCPELNMCVLGAATELPTSSTTVAVSATVPASWDGIEVYGWVFASIAETPIDPDAFDTTSIRLPKSSTPAEYLGQGEIA